MHIETDDLVQKLSENDEKFLVAGITEKFDRFNFERSSQLTDIKLVRDAIYNSSTTGSIYHGPATDCQPIVEDLDQLWHLKVVMWASQQQILKSVPGIIICFLLILCKASNL